MVGLERGSDVAEGNKTLGYSLVALLSAVTIGCGVCRPSPETAAQVAVAARAPSPDNRLLLLVVFDQLGSDTLERHLPYLDADGAIRTGIAQGAYFPRARYPQAVTLTGPGHALIATGAAPERTGITANEMRMADGTFARCVDGGAYPVFGAPAFSVAPSLLAAPTVADALRSRYGAASRIVSLSVKDRGAVLPAGQHPDVVLWFEPASGEFTTSAYYGAERPRWVGEFEAQRPLEAALTPWLVPDPEALIQRLGPDAAPGEADVLGFGIAFPHDPKRSAAPNQVLRMSPALSERLILLAEQAAQVERLGRHPRPDLLLLSISGTDYAGHAFGPDSWEYFDHLRRADRALGALVRVLSARSALSVLITSDHGAAQLPELRAGRSRLSPRALIEPLEQALSTSHGQGPWVERFSGPYLYLTQKALAHPDQAGLRARVCQVLWEQVGVAGVVELSRDAEPAEGGDCALGRLSAALQEAVRSSLYPGRSGDFYVIPREGNLLTEEEGSTAGTNHGSPWGYDRTVPVIAFGAGVMHVRHDADVDMRQVAPTLAELLGVPAPAAAGSPPLPGMTTQ